MRPIESAEELLSEGESAIVLFTRGDHLEISEGGFATSGNWKIDPKRVHDRVILYLRDDSVDPDVAEVLVGRFTGIAQSPQPGRFVLLVEDLQRCGETGRRWGEFARAGTNPVRYLSVPHRSDPADR
jgi:hypothetical protein